MLQKKNFNLLIFNALKMQMLHTKTRLSHAFDLTL